MKKAVRFFDNSKKIVVFPVMDFNRMKMVQHVKGLELNGR